MYCSTLYSKNVEHKLTYLLTYAIVTRSIAVLPVNWATMAVRSIDHKSAFKMNFKQILCVFKILKKFMHI